MTTSITDLGSFVSQSHYVPQATNPEPTLLRAGSPWEARGLQAPAAMLHMAGNSSSFLEQSSKRDNPCQPVPHLSWLSEQLKVLCL